MDPKNVDEWDCQKANFMIVQNWSVSTEVFRRNLDEDIIADIVSASYDDGQWDVDTLISSDGVS